MYTWFLIDLLGTFPFERFIKAESASRKSLKLIKYFKIPKLLRISRLMKYVRDHKFVYDIFQVFVLVVTFLHVGACIWMLLLSPCTEISDVIGNVELCAQGNVDNLYAESFHLSTTMMLGVSNSHVVGDSTTLNLLTERRESDRGLIYTVSALLMIGGLFLVALLISELNVFIFGKMQGSAAFQRKISRVTHEMEYYAVPDELQLQVKAFYDYIWIHQKQYDDRVALLSDDQMSTDLQRKLALHLFKDVVSHISIFSEIDDLLLGEICLSLRTRIFLPEDMILFKGDVGKELFIIAKGVVEVLRDDLPPSQRNLSPPILLDNGSFFGEIALIMETRRTCSVQARTVCEVNILEQRTFDTILRENPDFAHRMNELVVSRQLERCLTKSATVSDDIQVSKDDMDTAISIVEKNMKKGLDRRMQEQSIRTPSRGSSQFSSQGLSRESTRRNMPRFSSTTTCASRDTISSHEFIPHSIPETNEDLPPTTALAHDRSTNRLDEVTQIIDDIARRSSVRFRNSGIHASTNNPRLRSDTMPQPRINPDLNPPRSRSSSDGSAQKSEALPIPAARRPSLVRRTEQERLTREQSYVRLKEEKKSNTHAFSIFDGEGEDAETMLVTGHYNPNRVKVDMSKVLPSILYSGDQNNILSRIEENQKVMLEKLSAHSQSQKLSEDTDG